MGPTLHCPAKVLIFLIAVLPGPLLATGSTDGGRQTLSLDGTWEVAEGPMETPPARFNHQVPVPGLMDEARPAFVEVGVKSNLREAFWYRRKFHFKGAAPSVAFLKVHKAAYGCRAYVNGKLVGEHFPSFTPAVFDVSSVLRGHDADNDLVIRVGAWRDSTPATVASGFDFEKSRYIPGLFDSVELILSGTPNIVRVQVAPDITNSLARVQAVLANKGPAKTIAVEFKIRQARSGKVAGEGKLEAVSLAENGDQIVEIKIPVRSCRLWSPEDPFLYELEVGTGSDTLKTRFGMREFHLDKPTGRAVLNGRPYFLRGSNVTLYRFFEDAICADRPWREDWVRRLHRAFKSMHWNSLRYCIGFPPEMWYRIADEEGILIQDEFPIWYGAKNWPAELKAEDLVQEYTEWMQERWNHPCVVIWDAQNETVTTETSKATHAVRKLDLSNRSWDNGYAEADAPGDSYESHPYLFHSPKFTLSGLARTPGVPRGNHRANTGNDPIIINEYDWLWLNRDGSPTTLSRNNYERLLGTNSTAAQRWDLCARYNAALTEFWRAHRACAGVLHFCGLGYSRTNGQTCDNFIDIEKLKFEPRFEEHMRAAFAPVGLMIDEWRAELPGGKSQEIPVIVINDTYERWTGKVRMRLQRAGKTLWQQTLPGVVEAAGEAHVFFSCKVPEQPGPYQLRAELLGGGAKGVKSLRDFNVADPALKQQKGLAVQTVTASSVYEQPGCDYRPQNAVDGSPETRWSSGFSDPQWLLLDLGVPRQISRVILDWEEASATAYAIQVSDDAVRWQEVYSTSTGQGGTEQISFPATTARYLRIYGTRRATQFGYSLWEVKVL